MLGEVTLYSRDESHGVSETEAIQKALHRAMDNGLFDEGVHQSIVRVTYVDVTDLNGREGNEESPVQSTAATSSQPAAVVNRVLLGCVLAAAGTLFVLGMVLSRHRRRYLVRQQAARGEPVGSGPPSPAPGSSPVAVDPLVDRMTVFTMMTSPTRAASATVLGGEEVQSETSFYLEGIGAAPVCFPTPSNLPSVPYLDGLCGDSGLLGVTTAPAEDPKAGLAGEAASERGGNYLSSPTDDSVYLEGASPKVGNQGAMRFM
jgi:hypothetical protein